MPPTTINGRTTGRYCCQAYARIGAPARDHQPHPHHNMTRGPNSSTNHRNVEPIEAQIARTRHYALHIEFLSILVAQGGHAGGTHAAPPERAQHTTHHTWSVLAQVEHCAKKLQGNGRARSTRPSHRNPLPHPNTPSKYLTAATQSKLPTARPWCSTNSAGWTQAPHWGLCCTCS